MCVCLSVQITDSLSTRQRYGLSWGQALVWNLYGSTAVQ
jgi:hypothetical protein